jgi:hypothetical protein
MDGAIPPIPLHLPSVDKGNFTFPLIAYKYIYIYVCVCVCVLLSISTNNTNRIADRGLLLLLVLFNNSVPITSVC